MPPKKKGGKKGKKGGKKSGKDESASASGEKSDSKEMNELGKEFFLIQIKDLEQRLSRYQKKCDELGLINAETEEKYKQLVQDRKEIVDFLKKSLEQRQDEIADLHDRLLGLQQAKDTEKESYENQLAQLKREFQETKDQLTSENMILGGKLSSLEEFKVQKEDLMKKFADLEEKLRNQEKQHTEKIYNLERKAVVDKDRLKKEMVLRVNTVAAEFRKVSNKQMADTTKRNIRENVSINAQLAKMSEKTKELVHDNDELREKEKQYKMQIELLESTQEELAKKNHSNIKVLKMMTSRARQQESILEELESRDQEYLQIEQESTQLREENDNLNSNVQQLEGELTTTTSKLRETTAERDSLLKANERLEEILASAASTMREVLSETPELDETDRLVRRKTMIERMLLVLNTAALIGKAPPPTDFFQQRPKTLMAPLSMVKNISKPDSSRIEPQTPADFPHYKLGDLGLVPRPPTISNKPAAFASKVTHLSATTRIGLKPNVDMAAIHPSALQKPNRLPTLVQKAT